MFRPLFLIALVLVSLCQPLPSEELYYDGRTNCLYTEDWYEDDYGAGYYDGCRAARLGIGLAVGVAIFVGMIAVVVKYGKQAHSH